MIHALKLSPIYYDAVQNGIKTCEFRKEDDKTFRVGDTIHLREFDADYTGRSCKVVVSHILRHEDFLPMPIGWALLSVRVLGSDTLCDDRTMPEDSTMMNKENNDRKVTFRISRDELAIMEEAMSRHKVKSMSEFVRMAIRSGCA
ncbi:MAG: DUF3850 domain-containing protein [Gudongella sp.]|nr:DUF3850 domain-containing protein [Gudongella sp.]